MDSNNAFSVLLIVLILSVSLFTPEVKAQSPTLADTLNYIISNVNWTSSSPFTSTWSIILANQNMSAFDEAINQNIVKADYINALYISRLAALNEYNSTIISEGTRTALQNISMCESLPINFNANNYGDPDNLNQGCLLLYNRFLVWAFKYAEEYGLTNKWNKTQAFADFARLFDKPPTGSVSGEMLWCDPQENWARSYSSRYYDEHAETLSMFLKFYEIGVQEALAYADKAWAGVQSHWNGQYYGYTGTSVVECEMGNFARIIDEYRQEKGGNISDWERVIQDLNYKLLANGWSSSGWAAPGVIVHANTNPQLRLYETLGAIIALHQCFPQFTPNMKASFYNLLTEHTSAWEGLIQSNLNNGSGYFRSVYPGSVPSNKATAVAAATLFLEGIVPITGNIAFPSREENYPLDATPFPVKKLKFDYENRKIRIPVTAGELAFIYGSLPVSYNFAADGVYEIEFTSDWNEIIAVNNEQSPPQTLEAFEGNASVSLFWSPPLCGGVAVTNYTILKRSLGDLETSIVEVGNVTSYIDVAVANGETYYYQITAVNSFGGSEPSNEAGVEVSGPVTHDSYDGLWHTSDFLIYLAATDSSGVNETYYRINDSSVQSASVDGQPKIIVESDANTLEYWSVDELGNEELPHKMLVQIKLEKTAPVGFIQINDGADHATSTRVTLTLTATDTMSGVYQVRFSNDGNWDTELWESPTTSKAWTLTSGDGTKTVYFQISDNAGLLSNTYSDTINLQSPSPSPTPTPTPTPTPSPTPTHTPTPSPAPTAESTPTPEVTPSLSPAPTISPSPTPSQPPEETPVNLYISIAIGAVIAVAIVVILRFRK